MVRTVLIGVLLVVLGGTVGVVASLTRAPARAFGSCSNVHYLTDAINDGGNLVNHRGVRVHTGMWIESVDASCVRVSSMFAMSNDEQNWNEVGWYDAEGDPTCHYTGSGPRLLWTAVDNGNYYCASQSPGGTALTMGQYDTFSVQNPNEDGNWEYWHNGAQFKSFTNPAFTAGYPLTNGERHSTGDQAYAEFEGLQWENGSGYHDWANPSASGLSGTNNDPNWCNQFDSDTHIEVVSC